MNTRRNRRAHLIALMAVVLALFACGSSVTPSPTSAVPTATPSPSPVPTSTPTLSARAAVTEYAEQCVAIRKNTPLGIVAHGTRADFMSYLSVEWGMMVPPPSLEAYHAAVQAVYDEWRTLPEDVEIDMNSPAGRRALDETFKLDRYVLDTLEESGCIDRRTTDP